MSQGPGALQKFEAPVASVKLNTVSERRPHVPCTSSTTRALAAASAFESVVQQIDRLGGAKQKGKQSSRGQAVLGATRPFSISAPARIKSWSFSTSSFSKKTSSRKNPPVS